MPVTVVQVGPCVVTQIKTIATDGYNALQLGFGEKKESRINKPMEGHFKKSGETRFAFLREVPVDDPDYKFGCIQDRRACRCHRHHQGTGFCRCGQTARFPWRQENPW